MSETATSDVWAFKDGVAVRCVALGIWHDVADAQARGLNATLTDAQKAEGYEYRAVRRK